MKYEIQTLNGDKDYPINVNLTIETPEELGDLVGRAGLMICRNLEIKNLLRNAQPFDDLPAPADLPMENFYVELEEFVAEFLYDEEG